MAHYFVAISLQVLKIEYLYIGIVSFHFSSSQFLISLIYLVQYLCFTLRYVNTIIFLL